MRFGFHYILRDICNLFFKEWKDFEPPCHTGSPATKLINHLVSVAGDTGNGIRKTKKIPENVHLIQRLMTKWKTFAINKRLILDFLDFEAPAKTIGEVVVGKEVQVKRKGVAVLGKITARLQETFTVEYLGGIQEKSVDKCRITLLSNQSTFGQKISKICGSDFAFLKIPIR